MAARIRLVDGREINVMLSGKRVIQELAETTAEQGFARFKSAAGDPVWINPAHVASVEERPNEL